MFCYTCTQTHTCLSVRSHRGAEMQFGKRTGNGIHLSNSDSRDATAIAQIALFCQPHVAKLILIIRYTRCRQMSHRRGKQVTSFYCFHSAVFFYTDKPVVRCRQPHEAGNASKSVPASWLEFFFGIIKLVHPFQKGRLSPL